MIRSDGGLVTPHQWSCSSEGNVDFTRVFCTPPEQPPAQSKTCGEKSVSLRVNGRAATTGRLEAFAWCTSGGGANAECVVDTSGAGPQACSDSEAAHPEFLMHGNQVACQVTHSGVDAKWKGTCQITVSHAPQTTPTMTLQMSESDDSIHLVSTTSGVDWSHMGISADVTGNRCQLNAPATMASRCVVPDSLNVPVSDQFPSEAVAGDTIFLCSEAGSPASMGPSTIVLEYNPTASIIVSFMFDSIAVCP